jgi:hypothetical protein
MHETLRNLIDEFRTAQDVGVCVLVNDLKIPRPKSGLDWHDYCCRHGLFQVRLIDEVGFYAHGYGVELKIRGLIIDFDWGDNGEADGFDVWRLYNFAVENHSSFSASFAAIESWMATSLQNGELVKEGYTYYDPSRRTNDHPAI